MEAGGWRHRPALPPSIPYEPGHVDARSWGRERIKRYLRRNERFWRNIIQYFQEIIQATFQKVETYTNRQPWHPMGRRRMVGERTRKHDPRASFQSVSSDMSRRAGPGKTRACTGGRRRGTEGQQPLSSSTARTCASATSTPSHQDDSKVLLKEETERQHECTELTGHKQTVP